MINRVSISIGNIRLMKYMTFNRYLVLFSDVNLKRYSYASELGSEERRQDVFSCLLPTLLHTSSVKLYITTLNVVERLNIKHFRFLCFLSH